MFAKFSVKRPHMIIVAIILVVILGYLSFTNTGVDFLPNINLPYIVVATIYPGGESPDAVEQKVTAPLEQALATANNIKNISTESYPMISLIILELKSGTNVDAVLVEINEKIKTFKTISFGAGLLDSAADAGSGSSLTDEYSGITDLINNILDPIVMTLNPSMLPIMKLSLRQEGKTIGESSEYLKSVAQKLESIDGVASVDVTGLVESMYFVNVDNGKLIKSVLSSFIDFDGLFNGLYDMLLAVAESGASGALSDDATDILNGVKAAAAYASSEVKNVVSQIYDYAGYIPLNIINSVFDGIYAETDRVFDDLQSVYAGDVLMLAVVDAAKQGIIAAVDGAKRRFISYAEGLEQSSLDVVDDIEKNFSEALDGVIDWVKENLPGINDAIAPEAEFLREYLKNPQVRREFELLFKDGLDNMLDYIGTGLGDVIGADLLELAIFANNLEMPVGAIGGTLITVGDRIKTAEELYGLPVATINVVDMIISGITGLHLYDLEALSKQNAAALIFADGLLSAVTNPAATSSSILSAIFQDLDKAGLSTDTVLGLLGLAGIDKGFLENLENMGNSLGENGISLSALIEANQAFGEAIGDLSELNILLKLDDICNIAKIDNTSLLHTILNGSAGVQFNINKNPSSSTAEVSEAVRKALDDLTKNDPSLKYAILDDQGDYIQLVIDTILNNLLIGGLLAILILLVFLKKIGPTAVVGMSIIFSIVLTFIMMWAVGINLNIASMAGLALGVGMLVDNSIIVIENIFSLKSRGKGIFEAAIEGTNKVTGAVIASTVTTLVVFVPLFFTSGMITDIFKDLALTMSFSILSSLIVALTFVPMAATTFIKNVDKVSPLQEKVFAKFFEITTAVKKKSKLLAYVTSPFVVLANLFIKETSERDGKLFNIIKNGYGKLLQLCLKKKFIPLLTVSVLFGVSVLTAAFMGSQVLPDLDMNTINMHVNFDEARLFDYDIDKNDLLQSVMYIADDRINERKAANQVADSGISVYSGFKIMGTSVSELGGGIVNTDGMFSGTMFGGAVSGGDLECTILLNDKKKRKASAGDIAAKVAEDILSAKYDKYEDGKFIASYNLSEFTNISYSFNSIAEVASLDSDFVQLNVYSANQKDLENEVKNITAALRNAGIKGLTSVANTVDNPQLEYRLIIDKEALSAKAGGYNATVLLELLRRFKEPSASASVTLDNADGSAYTYNITFYPSARKVEKWYRTNSERYGRLYVEESLVTDENGVDRVEESYFTYDGAGTKYHLTKIEENGREKFVETANAYFTLEKKSDILYFSTDYRNPIDTAYDLLHYELPYENLLTGETGTVPLHEVLKEECIERNDDGEPVNIVQTPAYTKVTKSGGARYMPITIYFNGDTSVNQVKSAINKTLNNFYKSEGLPDGVSYGFSSSTALVDEIFSTLYFILGVGIVLIYLVMVGQFRSLKDPFIILFTILLAFTGSVFSLAVFGMELSIISIMAFIVLAGVVVNNGIVFIDYTNQLTRGGMPIREAILKTASSRLRPILMTAFTTIISLLVMAFDGTQAASILRPMGTAAVGGLLYSTMLTLFIVPILLDIFKKERPGKKKRIRLFAENYEYFNRQEREGK